MQPIVKRPVPVAVVAKYWRISLGIGLAVIGAVAFLLTLLARTAERIDEAAAEIWRVGKLIANNTVHVPLLLRTNQLVSRILSATEGIERATRRVEQAIASAADREGAKR